LASATGLSDGQTAADFEGAAVHGDTATAQLARESAFPPELLSAALGFRFADAVASSEQDRLAITQVVGASASALQATVRAIFGVRQLGRLLRRGPRAELESTLEGLRASELRKLVVSLSAEDDDSIPPGEAGRMLCSALPTTLQQLVLAKFEPSVLAAVAGAVRAGNLQELVIGVTLAPVSAGEVAQLSDALADGGAQLRVLALYRTGLDEAACELLGRALEQHSALEQLRLSLNHIGAGGAAALARALERHAGLQVLWLNGNQIGDEGVAALSRALEGHKALRQLELSGNQVGDEGTTALARALAGHTGLQRLDLSDNRIGKEGAAALSRALEGHTSLQPINLSGNQIAGDA
jgi:hypothetical protein